MAWDNPEKQAAVDPDNPTADEQVPAAEWNEMVNYLKDKITGRNVIETALADKRILIYDIVSDSFVFEDQQTVPDLIGDLSNVTISGVPANNEVLAYDTTTAHWINKTSAEAELATIGEMETYLPLTGGTLTGSLSMGANGISARHIQATDSTGVKIKNSGGMDQIVIGGPGAEVLINGNLHMFIGQIKDLIDPDDSQDAATKRYADSFLLGKDVTQTFLDNHIPVYRTVSGKFEMEEQSRGLELPIIDTTAIAKGSADSTKLVRFEVDGITSGRTRVLTVPDKDLTLCDEEEVMLLSGSQAMEGDLDIAGQGIINLHTIRAHNSLGAILFDSSGIGKLAIAVDPWAFRAYANANMDTHRLLNLGDPTDPQDAATKSYVDSLSIGLPVSEMTSIVKGSVDGTKQMRFGVAELTTGRTRVLTVPDKDLMICDKAEAVLRSGSQAMTGDLHVDSGKIYIEGNSATLNLTRYDIIMASVYYQPTLNMMILEAYNHNTASHIPLRVSASYLDMYSKNIQEVAGFVLHDASELTISSGVITATQSYHKIDTQSDAASDDLDTISGGIAGQTLILRATDSARTVIVKDGTGNIQLEGDMRLDDTQDTLSLIYDGTNWLETSRANNGA